ncbi:hypothetical protein K9L04_01850 [Patescibacteria group bacterium]|nr:hypothetical protein [Patescibacteria group bacterium]
MKEKNKKNKTIIEKALVKIEKDNVKIDPKWKFTLKNILTWFFIIILSLFTSISISLILFLFKTFSLSLAFNFKLPFFQVFFTIFPFFWLIFFLLFFLIILIIYRKKTKNGYKYAWYEILFPFFAIILIFGIFLSSNDEINEDINTKTIERVPLYKNIEEKRTHFLFNPEKGSIYGTITEISPSGIKVLDIDNNNWNVDIKTAKFICSHCLTFGKAIHIMGNCNPSDCLKTYSFEAYEITPFGRNILLKQHIKY